jgi:hypothetical protein
VLAVLVTELASKRILPVPPLAPIELLQFPPAPFAEIVPSPVIVLAINLMAPPLPAPPAPA